MFYICWISLLWNLYFLYVEKDPANVPDILRFLDEQKAISLPAEQPFSQYNRLYYVTEIMVFTFALIGIYSNSSCCLNLLIGSETVILLMYVFMTLYKVNLSRHEASDGSNSIDPISTFLITAFKYYLYLIILSFYNEVSNGRDGRGLGGIVIATSAVPSPYAPASAPSVTEHTIPASSYIDSPYAIQPPHAPIITQPCTSIYPPHEFPHIVVQTDIVAPCAPPPYPMPQPVVMNEKPPPYAP